MDIFNRFKAALKPRQVLVENEVFQLHYRVTAILLLACAALVASKQHFGDPIDCITRDDVPNKIMDTYCWIHSTFTMPNACNKTVGIEVAHPCVDSFNGENEDRIYHKYYQWVYFVLFFQAMFFYAPHFFWKMFESKLMTRLTEDFQNPLFKKEQGEAKIKDIIKFLTRNRDRHQSYYRYFTLFEFLNLVNVIVQIHVVDSFLGGMFTTYGLDVLNYVQMDQYQRVDPMVKIFPRMTKCTFHRFGSSGDVQKYDALCILPLNIINEKIYIVMWFWFVFLAVVTCLWLIYRLLTFFQPNLRYKVLRKKASLVSRKDLTYVLNELDVGDWFLLSMMCKNMESQWFRFLISNLRKELVKMSQAKIGNRNNRHHHRNRDKEDLEDEESDTESGETGDAIALTKTIA